LVEVKFNMEKNVNADFKLIKNSKGESIGHVKKLWFIEFLRKVYDIYGLYFDSIIGFNLIDSKIKKYQKYFLENNKKSIEDFNKESYICSSGNPGSKDSYTEYISKIGEVKERNKKDGENYKIIANLCLVLIYQYWENYYRVKIANDIGLEKAKDLELDIFGEIKILRESIIHHRAIALDKVEDFKLLKWFKKGDKIEIDAKQFEKIIEYIFYSVLNDISEEYKKYGAILFKQPKIS